MILKEKVDYCLGCINKNCKSGCPLSNDITQSIKYVKEGNMELAYKEFSKTSFLSSICGRVCPHTKQCQSKCVRAIKGEPVDIGYIESVVGDYGLDNNIPFENTENTEMISKKVAIVGSGPCGITCAAKLKQLGIENVDIYDKKSYLGGLLIHGIPEFRLPKKIVEKAYKKIIDLGINVHLNCNLGKDVTLDELKEKYDAVLIAIGSNISTHMGIEGETLDGVYGANELLEYRDFPDFTGKTVMVNGGGNVAMDACRTIKRLGAKDVFVIYRRAEEQMPAEKKEIKEAKEEGIKFLFQNNIVRIIGDKKVEKIECIKTELVDKGEGRLSPVNIEGSNYYIDLDYVVMAIGSKMENGVVDSLEKNDWGKIKVDEHYRTSMDKVYAAGDVAGVKSTIAWASFSGREAAINIYEDLKK